MFKNKARLLLVLSITASFWLINNLLHSEAEAQSNKKQDQALELKSQAKKTETTIILTASEPKKNENGSPSDLLQLFKRHLVQMGACLNLNPNLDGLILDLKTEGLIETLKNELGDPLVRTEDWSTTKVKTTNGEIRQIHLQTIFDDEVVGRKLVYSSIDSNNQETILELSQEQSENPTDTLIASLESTGTIISKSTSTRIYFSNGEELIVNENDGKIIKFEITRDGKNFSCPNTATLESQCLCH